MAAFARPAASASASLDSDAAALVFALAGTADGAALAFALAGTAAAVSSAVRLIRAAHMTDRDSAAVFVRACAALVCADRARLDYAVMNSYDPSVPIVFIK